LYDMFIAYLLLRANLQQKTKEVEEISGMILGISNQTNLVYAQGVKESIQKIEVSTQQMQQAE